MSWLPIQAPPVSRPELIVAHRTVDVVHGTPEQLIAMRMRLTHEIGRASCRERVCLAV